jgi:hypothetical protein
VPASCTIRPSRSRRCASCASRPTRGASMRGLRAPGTGIPGVIMLGTTRWKGVRDFDAVYRNRPGVVVELEGASYGRFVVTTDDPERVAVRTERSGRASRPAGSALRARRRALPGPVRRRSGRAPFWPCLKLTGCCCCAIMRTYVRYALRVARFFPTIEDTLAFGGSAARLARSADAT